MICCGPSTHYFRYLDRSILLHDLQSSLSWCAKQGPPFLGTLLDPCARLAGPERQVGVAFAQAGRAVRTGPVAVGSEGVGYC